MTTINISLPDKLKKQTDLLVKYGYFASFSDVIRTSLRQTLTQSKYDLMAEQAKEDYKKGRGVVLKSSKDIEKYLDSL